MKLTSVIYKTSYPKNETHTVFFKCKCGCESFYRAKVDYQYSFLTGNYFCINCKSIHNYYSDAFYYDKQTKQPTQLTLF